MNARRISRLLIAAALSFIFLFYSFEPLRLQAKHFVLPWSRPDWSLDQPYCWDLPGAAETLVVTKTGATEIANRFPVHLQSTIKCYPKFVVFSDYGEIYQGQQVLDALDTGDPYIQQTNSDFELYRNLQAGGRTSLTYDRLGGMSSGPDDGGGKGDQPGWRLDKWKFLPILNHTFHLYPDKKWYTFVETDTYMFWATMLQFQASLDHTKPYYMGSQNWIGVDAFAHGGSGFVVSNPALRLFVNYYATHQEELEDFTADHWAGDCVLGKAFNDSGVPLTGAWPIIQGDHPGVLPFGRNIDDVSTSAWCCAITTYHHVAPNVIKDLWDFEQWWIGQDPLGQHSGRPPLRNRDVLVHWITPQMRESRSEWNNGSEDPQEGIEDLQEGMSNLQECRVACELQQECLQYLFDTRTGQCTTSIDPKLGEKAPDSGLMSGWIFDRIEGWQNERPDCTTVRWLEA